MTKESDVIREIKKFAINPIDKNDFFSFLEENVSSVSYDAILAQKIIPKIFQSKRLSNVDRNIIFKIIVDKYQKEKIENYIMFVETMFPVIERIKKRISVRIKRNFNDSLFIFLYTLGMYIFENPDIISYPQKMLVKVAKEVLHDDTSWPEAIEKIEIAKITYFKKKKVIFEIYNEAVKCGCLYEKFNDISYFKEEILSINIVNKKIFLEIAMSDPDYQYGLQMGCAYNTEVFKSRLENEAKKPEIIHKFYKRFVCKRCSEIKNGAEIVDIILGFVKRQFAAVSVTDLLLLNTINIALIIFSLLIYLYIELLMIVLTNNESYKVLECNEIIRNIYYSDKISDLDFRRCIDSVFSNENNLISDKTEIPFFRNENQIIIAKWMFNCNFCVCEEMRSIVLNARGNSEFGKNADYFGKKVYEEFIKNILIDFKWKVLESGLKVKCTDFDLVGFKNGRVILGQVKVAHCGREHYQVWKAEKTIEQGIRQINDCKCAMQKDEYLIYSNLKREGIVKCRLDIKSVDYVIITSSSYFTRKSTIPILGIEFLKDLLLLEMNDDECFDSFLRDPLSAYDMENFPEYKKSKIDTREYCIIYDEMEF